ncbi:MAG TPA: MMPL family transporter [Solirubrobacterales bacterium]|nr:MMPL family transporter [Solirubrobacterales bacterium]
MRDVFARIAGRCVERPAPVIAAFALLALVAAVAALMLEADAGTEQLVDEDSETFVATEEFKDEFGDDPVVVLVRGDLEQLVLTENLGTLLTLEACLSGNAAPAEGVEVPAPCAELAETKPARVVYGPATFLNQFARQAGILLNQQAKAAVRQSRAAAVQAALEARRNGAPRAEARAAAELAAEQVLNQFIQQIYGLAVEYGQSGVPRLDDPAFVSSVVFDPATQGEPKARFSYLFPSGDAALISIRLDPGLSEAERSDAIETIRAAVADDAFRIRDASYVVSGVPVIIDDLAGSLSDEIFVLLAIALAVMALALAIFVGPPLRLLPLAIALGATALTFGGLAALGGSLTLASIAVLPVLIGLSVDYAIQFQARFAEFRRAGDSAARAAVAAAAASGPVIGTAALATGAGFLILLLWPIPVIRTFGLLLLAGIAFAFALSLTAGLAVLSTRGEGGRTAAGLRARMPALPALSRIGGAWNRLGARLRRLGKAAVATSMTHAGRLLAVAVAIAALGWIGGTQTDVNADIRELLPSDLQALEDAEELERGAGVSGEIDVTVHAEDLTDPEVIAWMADYKQRVLERAGFDEGADLCVAQDARLCPSIALPDLFTGNETPTQERIQSVLDLLPRYFSQAVVSTDPETGELGNTSVIAFGIKVMPFDEQKELVDAIRAEINPPGSENDPPEGVTAEVVGLPVLVADASSSLTRDRYLLTLGGLLAVALALLAVYRSTRRALVPLIPIMLATGWSACAVWVLGVDLNPMSATLGALVIAIATEFSVLLAARYEEERRRGLALGDALRAAYSSTGLAVLASGVTATAGFAVLVASDIPLLRDFGLVTVLDLGVALVGVLAVLPATLIWAEGGFAPFGRLIERLRARRQRASTATP